MVAGKKTGGRVAGTPNKTTAAVKEALTAAFDEIGGSANLATWARANETEFYRLWVKMLPTEVAGSVSLLTVPLKEEDEALLNEYLSK